MLWRTYLLNRLVGPRDIRFLVGRHSVVYAKVLVQYTAVFLLLFFVYRVIRLWVVHDLLQIIFGSIIGVLYLLAIFFLLRSYFDVLVATNDHLYIVLWDSFFKYRIKIITRSSIQDISVSPASGLSSIFKDGHISISTEQDDVIHFNDLYQPSLVAKSLYSLRDKHTSHELDPDIYKDTPETHVDDEKFKILVETLGEVIVDYMKKKE